MIFLPNYFKKVLRQGIILPMALVGSLGGYKEHDIHKDRDISYVEKGDAKMNYEDTIPGLVDAQIPKYKWLPDKVPTLVTEYFYSDEVKSGIHDRVKGKLDKIPATDKEKEELVGLITDEITSKDNYDQIFNAIGDHHGFFSSSDKTARIAHKDILSDVRSSLSKNVLNQNGVSNNILCHYVQEKLGIEKENTQHFLTTIIESARNERKDKENKSIWDRLSKKDPMKEVMKTILPDDFQVNHNEVKKSVLSLVQKGLENDPKNCYLALRDSLFEKTPDGFKYKEGIDNGLKEYMDYYLAPYKKTAEENGLRFNNNDEFLKYADSVAQFVLNDPRGEKEMSNYIAAFTASPEEKQKAASALEKTIFAKAKAAGIFYHETLQNTPGLKSVLKQYSADDPKSTYLALRETVFEKTPDGFKYKESLDKGLEERMDYYITPFKKTAEENGLRFKNNEEFLKYTDSVVQAVLDDSNGKKAMSNYIAAFTATPEEKKEAESVLRNVITQKARNEGIIYHKAAKPLKGLKSIFENLLGQKENKPIPNKKEANSQMLAYNISKIKGNREC